MVKLCTTLFLTEMLSHATMKLNYYSDTDSLYIELSERPSSDTREIAPGVLLDFDEHGRLVGIDVDQASRLTDLSKLETVTLPLH
jgi:uncharacterized protein YuzE